MHQPSALQSRLHRAALAFALVLCVAVLDGWLRSSAPTVAEAVYSGGLTTSNSAAGVDLSQLKPVGVGTIPMPEGALAAHASSLLAMPEGHPAALTAFWFAGDRESAPNVQIAASQFDRATQAWSPARFVVNRHAIGQTLGFGVRRLGNPVAWLDASNRVHLFVVATGWGGWAASRVLHLVQSGPKNRLSGLSFAPVRVLPLSWLWNTSYLVRNAPLPLADGGMVLPAHFEIGSKFPVALRFDKSGEFLGMVRLSQRDYLLQPTLLPQTKRHWVALMRDTRHNGRITAVQTLDGGQHWVDLPDLSETNPDAAVVGLSLAPGQSLLVHNTSPHSRALLDLSASKDGLYWTRVQALAHGGEGDEYSYPALTWADQSLWVSYTDHRRSIAWQRFAVDGKGAP